MKKEMEAELREELGMDKVRLGLHAAQLLEDPVFLAAWAAVEDQLNGVWRSSKPEDVKGRERVYFQLRALREVRKELQKLLESGTLEAARLKNVEAEGKGNGVRD
jgi:hypothetical protein